MDYPQDFPAESRAKVEAARIRAGRQFDSKSAEAKWRSDIEALFWTYVLTPFLVFAEESARLGLWPADKMDQNCREFLRLLTIDAYYQKGKGAGVRDMTSNWNGSILWEADQKIEKTSQWRKYENIRLKFAVKGKPTTQSTAQNSATSAPPVERKPERDNPEVAKRAAIVRSNPGTPADKMCEIFDRENVSLPRKWLDAGFSAWSKAYRNSNYRSRIHTLISKDRRRRN